MRRIACLVGFLVVVVPAAAHGQPWSGILSPSRATDWRNVGVLGGIPKRTTICATLTPGATAAQITNAVSACPSGQVVQLSAGTYTLTSPLELRTSNVTLRGAGADKTKLVFRVNVGGNCSWSEGASLCLRGDGYTDPPLHTANWTAGYAPGTTVVTLSNTTGLVVGNMLTLDQLDDASDGYPVPGGIYVCSNCSGEGGGHAASNAGRGGRSQAQFVTVTAINGNNVTISPGLHMPNWRASQNPGAWWGNVTIRNTGIEDLTLDHSANGSRPGIMIFNGLNCWIKGVRSVIAASDSNAAFVNHVRLLQVGRTTVRDSYFYGKFRAGSTMYGINIEAGSDVLLENNIGHDIEFPIYQVGADAGSVIGYNFVVKTSNGWTISGGGQHNVAAGMTLYEGNNGPNFTGDIIHGSGAFTTQFRNHWNTDLVDGSDTSQWIQSYHRFYNVIGNVLGFPGWHNTYETSLQTQTKKEIYSLGSKRCDGTNCSSYANVANDPFVKTTLMRWGNYDTVSAAVRFVNGEVPSGLANFANLIPASQALPASFYLSARPAWWPTPWGTPPWPAIGPEVTGGNMAGYAGHANKIPARLCWENSPVDSAYGGDVRLFNANNCYEGSVSQAVPAPPTSPVVQ